MKEFLEVQKYKELKEENQKQNPEGRMGGRSCVKNFIETTELLLKKKRKSIEDKIQRFQSNVQLEVVE